MSGQAQAELSRSSLVDEDRRSAVSVCAGHFNESWNIGVASVNYGNIEPLAHAGERS